MTLNLTAEMADLIGGALGFAMTIAIFSYLIGDNPLYRLAVHLFVGAAAGYAALVVLYQVLTPRLIAPLRSADTTTMTLTVIPLILFVFLILKLSPRTSAMGNVSIAYMIGVGVAVAVGGAVTGTLLPQVRLAWQAGGSLVAGIIILVGAVCALLYFQFWLRPAASGGQPERGPVLRVIAGTGKGFIVVALGAVYAGLILSGIAVFSQRVLDLYGWASSQLPLP